MPFQGASTICSPSSIALARTTSSSAVSRATLPISLRYIRTGSSIPIMSAEMASSSSAEGSSTSFGSSLAGLGRQLGGRIDGAVLGDDHDADVGAVLGGRLGAESRSSSSSSSSSPATATAGLGSGRAKTAILASSRSALARRGRDRTASTSCLSRGSADMVTSGGWPAAGSARGAGRATGALH